MIPLFCKFQAGVAKTSPQTMYMRSKSQVSTQNFLKKNFFK